MSHNADDIVAPEGANRRTPGAITRLEAAELERRNLITQELDQHRDNLDAELSRHRAAMGHIAAHFGRQMTVA